MTNEEIFEIAKQAGFHYPSIDCLLVPFANLVAEREREACIDIIETYSIPVGNSASGELACEWTYEALHKIRDDIRARGEK